MGFFAVALAQVEPATSIWVLEIEGEITPATAQYVSSRVERANRERPLALAIVINTPGGRVDAMKTIANTILNRSRVPTIAIVEDAFSAGALIAMSADDLVMLPGSSIGAALTVVIDPTSQTGLRAADEKINSATQSQFAAIAEAQGRNVRFAEAMVDPKIDIPGLAGPGELLTLSADQAVEHNIADLKARDLDDALGQLGYGSPVIEFLEPSLTERAASALSSPLIFSALLALGIIGILIELFSPGFGAPGVLGGLALALALGGAYIATPAGPLDFVLILAGILLIAAEILVIPGFGIAAVLGLAALIVATFRIFQDQTLLVLSYSTVFGGLVLAALIWLLPRTRVGNALTLSTRLLNTESTSPEEARHSGSMAYLKNQRGTAISDLRPAGNARFGSERVDVVTEGDYVSTGTELEVIRVEGTRVVVRAVES